MAISVQQLRRTYGAFTAVDDLSFEVGRGEIVGLIGPNGAGKTTTLRMLTTLLEPDGGTCRIDGIDVFRDPMASRKRLGVLPDVHGLYPRLTPALDGLAQALDQLGRKDRAAEVRQLMAR